MLGENLIKLRKKQGYSQQDVAELLSVTRQTISNWECDKASPALNQAAELAKIYHVSLDDIAGNEVEVIAAGGEEQKSSHILRGLVGKLCRIESDNMELRMGAATAKILDVNADWLRVEYVRTKDNTFFQKEKVIHLIELSSVNGFEIVEESI